MEIICKCELKWDFMVPAVLQLENATWEQSVLRSAVGIVRVIKYTYWSVKSHGAQKGQWNRPSSSSVLTLIVHFFVARHHKFEGLRQQQSSWSSPVFPGSGIRENLGWLLSGFRQLQLHGASSGLFGSPEATEHTGFLCDTWNLDKYCSDYGEVGCMKL